MICALKSLSGGRSAGYPSTASRWRLNVGRLVVDTDAYHIELDERLVALATTSLWFTVGQEPPQTQRR